MAEFYPDYVNTMRDYEEYRPNVASPVIYKDKAGDYIRYIRGVQCKANNIMSIASLMLKEEGIDPYTRVDVMKENGTCILWQIQLNYLATVQLQKE